MSGQFQNAGPDEETAAILVAAGDADTLRLIESALGEAGYAVVTARDGIECLELIKRRLPQIVILDWEMPRMDGLEVCRAARGEPLLSSTYIIMVTSKAAPLDKTTALDHGADDFLTKPCDRDELLARVRVAHRIQSLTQDLAEALSQVRNDLSAAVAVQQDLLPDQATEFPPLSFGWEFRPASSMAGDLFDVFQIDEDHVALYLFDISGHGVTPAMLSVSLHHFLSPGPVDGSLIKSPTSTPPYYRLTPPEEVARRLNQRFPIESNGLYFTLFYGLINLQTLFMRYCRAGHVPPVIIQQGRPIRLEEGDTPVGLLSDAKYHGHSFQFQPGDRMLICSDAVTEAADSQDVFFGMEGVERTLLETQGQPPSEMVQALVSRVEAWQGRGQFDDDFSVLMMEVAK